MPEQSPTPENAYTECSSCPECEELPWSEAIALAIRTPATIMALGFALSMLLRAL